MCKGKDLQAKAGRYIHKKDQETVSRSPRLYIDRVRGTSLLDRRNLDVTRRPCGRPGDERGSQRPWSRKMKRKMVDRPNGRPDWPNRANGTGIAIAYVAIHMNLPWLKKPLEAS